MNELVVKRASIFAVILGGLIGLVSAIPSLIGLCVITLSFFTSLIVIIYMKKNEKHLGIIDNKQGAILGAAIGFFSTIGFFLTFCPIVCILHFFFKTYYSYAIPDTIQTAFWLLIIIIFMVALMFAITNSATGMGIAWLYDKFEKKPENFENPVEFEIEN